MRIIEVDGQPFAVLIEPEDGSPYLVPPIVVNEDGAPIEGREVLEAIVQSGKSITHPVAKGATASDLARIDQIMQRLSDELGVPIGPPED